MRICLVDSLSLSSLSSLLLLPIMTIFHWSASYLLLCFLFFIFSLFQINLWLTFIIFIFYFIRKIDCYSCQAKIKRFFFGCSDISHHKLVVHQIRFLWRCWSYSKLIYISPAIFHPFFLKGYALVCFVFFETSTHLWEYVE